MTLIKQRVFFFIISDAEKILVCFFTCYFIHKCWVYTCNMIAHNVKGLMRNGDGFFPLRHYTFLSFFCATYMCYISDTEWCWEAYKDPSVLFHLTRLRLIKEFSIRSMCCMYYVLNTGIFTHTHIPSELISAWKFAVMWYQAEAWTFCSSSFLYEYTHI